MQGGQLAQSIYQAVLDGSGDAVQLADFPRYLPFLHLPHLVETFEGRVYLETPEDVRYVFDRLLEHMRAVEGAVKLKRTCTVAQFAGPNEIQGLHESQLLDKAGNPLESYSGLCTLSCIDGKWLMSSSQYAEGKAVYPTLLLRELLQKGCRTDPDL
ncbi:hypothetical protein K3728_04775 [Rhodobacteraceae bacterium M385]|nr:hypothetical protein K3728_04775 [Rhodobacteraceae bacterium M385]